MAIFDIPVTYLDVTRHVFSIVDLPLLDMLLCSSSHLAELRLQVSELWEAFKVVKKAALLHKRLSLVVLIQKQDEAQASIRFEQGTGELLEIKLDISDVPPKILTLPKLTALSISGSHADDRMEELALRGLDKFQELHTLEVKARMSQFFLALFTVQEAMQEEQRALTRVDIWGFTDNDTKSEFDLPPTHLELTQRVVLLEELPLLAKILDVSATIKDLRLLVSSLSEALDILRPGLYRQNVQSRLTLSCPDGSKDMVLFDGAQGAITSLDLYPSMDTIVVDQPYNLDPSDEPGLYHALQTRYLLELSSSTLAVLKVAQDATINNPSLRQLKVFNGDHPIVHDITIRQFSTETNILAIDADIPKLNRIVGVTISFDGRGDSIKSTVTLRLPDIAPIQNDIESAATLSPLITSQFGRLEVKDSAGSLASNLTSLDQGALKRLATQSSPPPPFSILRLPNEIFDALLSVFATATGNNNIQKIDIINSADTALVSFGLPAQYLDLGAVAVITPEDSSRLERVLAKTTQHLSELELSVDTLDENIHLILQAFKTQKHISSFLIKPKDGAYATFGFQSGTGAIINIDLQLQEEGTDRMYAGSEAVVKDDAIFQLRGLQEPELRLFATIQQLTTHHSGLLQLHIKDGLTGKQETIPIPILNMDLGRRVITEAGSHVVAWILDYCPLVSQVAITVDNLESAATPFVMTLPDRLQRL
ncbi:hypothetical protein BGX29_008268 [Mortierella sp. GBA35]|nr:hypothetical protein BGX29_008268 [Mortierella sp. GBA35]